MSVLSSFYQETGIDFQLWDIVDQARAQMYMQTTTWSHIQNPKLSFLQDKAETVVDTSWVMIHVSFEVSDTRDKLYFFDHFPIPNVETFVQKKKPQEPQNPKQRP